MTLLAVLFLPLSEAKAQKWTDISSEIINADFGTPGNANGWTIEREGGTSEVRAGCLEFWNNQHFKASQVIYGLPKGHYRLSVQGFHRYGDCDVDYQQHENNKQTSFAYLFVNKQKKTLTDYCSFSRSYESNNWLSPDGGGHYYPNTMEATAEAFAENAYWNSLEFDLIDDYINVTIGIGLDKYTEYNWCIFSHFKLETTNEITNEWTDVTRFFLASPNFDGNIRDGWICNYSAHTIDVQYECMEFWDGTFDIHQDLYGLPKGEYRLSAQAFYREGQNSDCYSNWKNGTIGLTALLYAGDREKPIKSVYDFSFNTDNTGNCWTPDGNNYYPDNMYSASSAFAAGAYKNVLLFNADGDIRLGLKNSNYVYGNWAIFDNFKLEYKGEVTVANNIQSLTVPKDTIEIGEKLLAELIVAPEEVMIKNVIWTSSNPLVFTVDGKGEITGRGIGSAKLIATMRDDSNISKSVNITVVRAGNTDNGEWINLTYLITNPNFKEAGNSNGWTIERYGGTTAVRAGCLEFWDNQSFKTSQVIENLSKGHYRLSVQGYHRYGDAEVDFEKFKRNEQTSMAYMFVDDQRENLAQYCSFYQTTGPNGWVTPDNGEHYYPNTMESAAEAFDKEAYWNFLEFDVEKDDTDVTIGIALDDYTTRNWCIFTNFKLEATDNSSYSGTRLLQDPETKVNYGYIMGKSDANVMKGHSYTAGSQDATGNVTILSGFTVDGYEYKVTRISEFAFYCLLNLTSITIPSCVTAIDNYSFLGCRNLMSISSFIKEPFAINDVFDYDVYRNATLYVPAGTIEAYKTTNGWKMFSKIIELEKEEEQQFPTQTMILHHSNGSKSEVSINEKSKVKFKDGKVIITSITGSKAYEKDDILRITYNYINSDVNGDYAIDVADIATVISIMAGSSDVSSLYADVNRDGVVDVADIATIISAMAGSGSSATEIATTANGTIGEAFYIYRNDNQFNAFFREEIDSIGFSHYDADSLRYNKIASQVVYTPDSTFMIPLVAIDSVGFVRPETKLQANVVLMDEKGMTDYLRTANGMSLTFDSGMPVNIRPKKDDILVCTDFDNPLFLEGFIGKVVSVSKLSDGLIVVCDSVYDITEIYEQLVSIEQIVVDNVPSRARRVSGEWISSRNSINFNLGYSHEISNGSASISGSIDGTYIATIAYNITKKEQYFSLKINHDWQYGAHLNFKCDNSFGTLLGNVNSLPAIRFPMPVPIFKFQISGAPFVKGDGSMELDLSFNSPVHSYLAEVKYHNGVFSGSNNRLPITGNNKPSFDAAFSLNGSLQVGYMVDFWLGTINALGSYVRTGLDFYIGPKLTGNFSISGGTSNPVNYYTAYKDSKLGLSLLTIDYEAFGE